MPNKPDLDHLHRLLAEGDIYRAVRGALQLQPPAAELAASFRSKPKPPGAGVADAIHRMLRGHSSNSSADAMADSIRQALPSHFEDWVENEGEAARQFLTAGKRALPPGFAEGRPGAFVRRTRGLLHVDAEGRSQSMPEMVRAIADPQEFQAAAMAGMRLTEVLDLLWMVEGSLELREVQELAARLWGAVIPEIEPRFTSYSAAGLTRYRAALAIEFEGTAAVGGILAEWAGRPAGVDAAHLRIFLEAWTNAQARQGGRTPHAQA